jgi:hypothetical protein
LICIFFLDGLRIPVAVGVDLLDNCILKVRYAAAVDRRGEGMPPKSGVAKRREAIRQEYWPTEDLWTGEREAGWFPAPRSLPLILVLLSSKEISSGKDPSTVYLDLLSRQRGEGVVEMAHEAEHAFAAGYEGKRAIRTWEERMRVLEELGFIRTVKIGNQRHKYAAIVHPTAAVQGLRKQNRISEAWWRAYIDNKRASGEATYEDRPVESPAA